MKKARGKNNKNKERLAPSRRKRDRVFAAINNLKILCKGIKNEIKFACVRKKPQKRRKTKTAEEK